MGSGAASSASPVMAVNRDSSDDEDCDDVCVSLSQRFVTSQLPAAQGAEKWCAICRERVYRQPADGGGALGGAGDSDGDLCEACKLDVITHCHAERKSPPMASPKAQADLRGWIPKKKHKPCVLPMPTRATAAADAAAADDDDDEVHYMSTSLSFE